MILVFETQQNVVNAPTVVVYVHQWQDIISLKIQAVNK
jgi:hypothetical protein